jgi:hypothetical protein
MWPVAVGAHTDVVGAVQDRTDHIESGLGGSEVVGLVERVGDRQGEDLGGALVDA